MPGVFFKKQRRQASSPTRITHDQETNGRRVSLNLYMGMFGVFGGSQNSYWAIEGKVSH